MSSTRVAINRVVITGRAVTNPVTKNVQSRHGDSTLTVFSIRTAKDTYIGSVIMEIHAWSRVAGKIAKGRIVAIDGQLTQHEYLAADGRKQTAPPSAVGEGPMAAQFIRRSGRERAFRQSALN